jgi:hypothetical protein
MLITLDTLWDIVSQTDLEPSFLAATCETCHNKSEASCEACEWKNDRGCVFRSHYYNSEESV